MSRSRICFFGGTTHNYINRGGILVVCRLITSPPTLKKKMILSLRQILVFIIIKVYRILKSDTMKNAGDIVIQSYCVTC